MTTAGWFDGGVYFLRHGESVSNRLDLVNGWADSPLTDMGVDQAYRATSILVHHPINRIVSSDLQRAQRTAEIVAESIGTIQVEVFSGLRERNWGLYEGLPRRQRPGLDQTPEGGEGPSEYYYRVCETLEVIKPTRNTLIVAHAGTARVLDTALNLMNPHHRIANSTPIQYLIVGSQVKHRVAQ